MNKYRIKYSDGSRSSYMARNAEQAIHKAIPFAALNGKYVTEVKRVYHSTAQKFHKHNPNLLSRRDRLFSFWCYMVNKASG